MSLNTVVWRLGLMVAGLAAPASAAGVSSPTRSQIEQAAIAAIPPWHGQKATILEYLDLTQPFDTVLAWSLVVAQDPHPYQDALSQEQNPIAVCLVNALVAHCTESLRKLPVFAPGDAACWASPCYSRTYGMRQTGVVFAGPGRSRPLLLLKVRSVRAPNGSAKVQTILYSYDRKSDRFRDVFVNDGGGNNNQDARFIEHGPLQGDEIVDFPTEHPPYVYWVEVYAPHGNGTYRRILRYRSRTHYADGNPLPVADSEMPAIMQRLGLSKPGDALPVPQPAPANCGKLVLNRGEEWCRNLCVNYGGNACSRLTKSRRGAVRGR